MNQKRTIDNVYILSVHIYGLETINLQTVYIAYHPKNELWGD